MTGRTQLLQGTILPFSLLMLLGCGLPPGTPPGLPGPVVWSGSIRVEAWIEPAEGEAHRPDSVGVILDGDSLGFHVNPDTIEDVGEGTHSVRLYGIHEGLIYVSPSHTVFVEYDRCTLLEAHLTRTGSLIITAASDEVEIDNFSVKLDGDTLGAGPNPRHIDQVPQGVHKLVAFTSLEGDDWEGWQREVEIVAAETTTVTVEMVEVSPDSGRHAPDIDPIDLDGQNRSLSDHWGEVIYLYFFEHT